LLGACRLHLVNLLIKALSRLFEWWDRSPQRWCGFGATLPDLHAFRLLCGWIHVF
jgi:hypothetical protein